MITVNDEPQYITAQYDDKMENVVIHDLIIDRTFTITKAQAEQLEKVLEELRLRGH